MRTKEPSSMWFKLVFRISMLSKPTKNPCNRTLCQIKICFVLFKSLHGLLPIPVFVRGEFLNAEQAIWRSELNWKKILTNRVRVGTKAFYFSRSLIVIELSIYMVVRHKLRKTRNRCDKLGSFWCWRSEANRQQANIHCSFFAYVSICRIFH